MIIKPLSDAIAHGDPVRSIILNSASNHSGRTQGISMPGSAAQEIGLDPNETTFVEVRNPVLQYVHKMAS